MLPQINSKSESITMLNTFLGLNRNLRINESEFSDLKNITNDYYPVIGNRKKRGIITNLTKPQGVLGGKYLAYVDDDKLYYNFKEICVLEKTGEERILVMMGAYLCVFPDGVIYNTYDEKISDIANETSADNVKISICKLDGTVYQEGVNVVTSKTEPTDTSMYWIDTSQDTVVMKVYSDTYAAWVSVPTTYVRLSAAGIGKGFSAYDAAKIDGIAAKGYNDYDFNQTNIIYDCGDDYLIIEGLAKTVGTNAGTVTVKREFPEMDFVTEQDNRLWGCSSKNHEIYACKQGDPKNWNFFGGLDSDSYAATVGTQNDFTGAVSYGGYVFFFKEDGYHRLYGTKPSNYELIWKPGRGIQKGSEKSIAIVNGYLFFKARDAVCCYSGSIEPISSALGTQPYYEAIAGVYRDKYYVGMRDEDYNYSLYVFDSTKNTWTVEDDIIISYMAYANDGMYIIDHDNRMFVVNSEIIYTYIFPMDGHRTEEFWYPGDESYPGVMMNGDLEDQIAWMLESGDIGMDSPYQKYIKRMILRLEMDAESCLKIEIMYDSTGSWEQVMEYYCARKKSFELPVPVRRCDHFRYRLSGWGEIRLYSIAKAMEEGSGKA
jgi:uncharacterized protein (DUF1330 family)